MTTSNQELPLLEAILRELETALVVCDCQGRIRFSNPAAQSLFRGHPGLLVGGSLYEVCNPGPIAHALRLLVQDNHDRPGREAPGTGLVCATIDNTILLHCRIRPLAIPGAPEALLLFTFADLSRQLADQGKAGRLPSALIEELRQPLSNLAAAAANLKEHPEMGAESRDDFAGIIYRESTALTDRFETLVWEERAANRQPWPLTDVNSADLLGCLVQRLAGAEGMVVTMSGAPLWLRADSYSLLLVLETLGRFIREIRRVTEIDLEVLLGDRRVYLDLVWPGAPIPQAALNRLLQSPLPEGGGGVTVAEVLLRHDSELWSQHHQRRPGFALLRLPLPHSPRQWQGGDAPVAPALADRPLAALEFVVFDTETTGLDPAGGDELLALTAVRVTPGRGIGNERFEQLVKPRQPMPAASLSLLAITGEMLDRAAPLGEVLRQFHAFVGGALPVAHGAPFGLNFSRGREAAAAPFAGPLLDTLLLARLVDAQRTDLTLAGLAEWLGMAEAKARTTMDSCLLTARIFLLLQERLAERGLTTLGQVLAASARLLERPAAEGETGRPDV